MVAKVCDKCVYFTSYLSTAMDYSIILDKLPYAPPFLFVDELSHMDESTAIGNFTFRDTMDFYRGHFKGKPITPGVILTECCAQIGLICLGIYLLNESNTLSNSSPNLIALTHSEMEFFKPVYPNEKVSVCSTKVYFRFGKLKCKVKMYNAGGSLVCQGVLSGIVTTTVNAT